MSQQLVTLQLGQCGNQLGAELFYTLAEELRSGSGQEGELSPAAGAFFYMAQAGGETRLTARSVLLDMEPKVVAAAARAGRGRWHYSRLGQLTRQSGSGNNWGMGYGLHGPAVRDQALNMVRRQVERCDAFGGFLLLQSLAGGTGSGLGTYLAEQLRDEYPSNFMLTHCTWPFETGEVAVQPYNALLSLSHLSRHCDGLVLSENEALAAACQKQLGLPRPTFADMNGLAARGLASVLLPSTVRPAAPETAGGGGSEGRRSGAGVGGRGGRSRGGGRRPAWDSSTGAEDAGAGSSSSSSSSSGGGAWDGSFDTGSRWGEEGGGSSGGGRRGSRAVGGSRGSGWGAGSSKPGQLRILGDVCEQLCAHPSYRLLTLRSVPQMPPGSVDFTTFNWPALLKRLKQMLATGRTVEAGLDWSTAFSGRPSAHTSTSAVNKSLSNLLVLRGVQAREADASPFLDPLLTPSWQTDPLLVAASPQRFAKLDMCATLLSNCQTPVAPVSRMLGKACRLYDARAYVHQYNRYGLECSDFEQAFEGVEDLLAKYQAL